MAKVVIKSTIPVGSFANIQPEIEVEAPSYEEAFQIADGHIQKLWAKYYNKTPGSSRVKQKAFIGGDYYYDALLHEYSNEDGEVYESASQYAESFKKPFDKDKIAKATAEKYQVEAKDVIDFWELKGLTSRTLGTAFHAAMQLEEQYRSLAKTLGKSSVHDYPLLKDAVTSFYEAHKDERTVNEAVILSHELKRAARVDRIVVTKRKHCIIDDFKFGATVKDLESYWKQLEFEKTIMEANDWFVDAVRVHHYNGSWHEYVN